MPNPDSRPGRVLRGGESISQAVTREAREHVFLSELRQPHGCKLPRHEHELAYFTVVLAGTYGESNSSCTAELHPFTAIYNPAGVIHDGIVGYGGTQLFTIEMRAEYLKEVGIRLRSAPNVDPGTGAILWPGLRIYSAFKAQAADPLTLDSLVLELLAAVAAAENVGKEPPIWFNRVRERMHQEFQADLSMRQLAMEAGVHPVHLARVFRAHCRQTPGDYVRRLRLRAACDLLRNQDFPLAAVAADCGFADQSHFTRIFKRELGSTPGDFRKRCLQK